MFTTMQADSNNIVPPAQDALSIVIALPANQDGLSEEGSIVDLPETSFENLRSSNENQISFNLSVLSDNQISFVVPNNSNYLNLENEFSSVSFEPPKNVFSVDDLNFETIDYSKDLFATYENDLANENQSERPGN